MQYDWPGNVRELRNVCERLIVLNDSDFVSAELLRQLKIFRESKAREPVILPEEQMEDTVYSRLKPKKKKKELAEELGDQPYRPCGVWQNDRASWSKSSGSRRSAREGAND